jgi:tetratricopeptide (TPR) repeat protein
MFLEHDFAGAETAFARAYAATPTHPVCLLGYGDLLLFTGRSEEALQRIREAIEVDPFDLGINMNAGDFLMLARRYAEAVTQLQKTLAMNPGFVPARLRLAEAFAYAGDPAAALAEVDRAALASRHRCGSTRHGHWCSRWPATSPARVAQHLSPPWSSGRRRLRAGAGHAALGDRDAAFRWLDVAIAEQWRRP